MEEKAKKQKQKMSCIATQEKDPSGIRALSSLAEIGCPVVEYYSGNMMERIHVRLWREGYLAPDERIWVNSNNFLLVLRFDGA